MAFRTMSRKKIAYLKFYLQGIILFSVFFMYGIFLTATAQALTIPAQDSESHWLETEFKANMTPPMQSAFDLSASSGKYIWVPNGAGVRGSAVYNFTVAQAGKYMIWGRTIAPNGSDDSFYIEIDETGNKVWSVTVGETWIWNKVTHAVRNIGVDKVTFEQVTFDLTAGTHQLKIKQREDGPKIDKILITNDFSYIPTGIGEKAENLPRISPSTIATITARVDEPYKATFTVDGDAELFNWDVKSGELPPGLVLSGSQLVGTPTAAGVYTFVINATQSSLLSLAKTYSIIVNPPVASGYEARKIDIINKHITNPWPKMSGGTLHWGYLIHGIASLFLNQNIKDVAIANENLSKFDAKLLTEIDTSPNRVNLVLSSLIRVYMLYNSHSSFYPGRLSQAAENNLEEQIWWYASQFSKISDASITADDSWRVYGSENIDMQEDAMHYLAAQIFKNLDAYKDRTYLDGNKAVAHYVAWDKHFSQYFDERAKKGLFVEVASGYIKYTMGGILNIYNFAENPVIRKKSEMILDLHFADWAQEQSGNHVRGGGKSRIYPGSGQIDGKRDVMKNYVDLLYGPTSVQDNNIDLATSGYYPPSIIYNLTSDPVGRGSYEYISRRPGVGLLGPLDNCCYEVSPTKSVLRKTYVTPDYVLGAALLNPADTYTQISSQNRWQGVVFNQDPFARIFTRVRSVDNESYLKQRMHNDYISVQGTNVLVTAKNKNNTFIPGYPSMIYFSRTLDQVNEEDGWIFVQEGDAYTAVKVVVGGYSWLTSARNTNPIDASNFISLNSEYSPIIIEAARVSDYKNFRAFKNKIKNNPITYINGVLTYTGSNGTKITYYANQTTIGKVNDVSLDFFPKKVFDSPFMDSDWNSGLITVNKGKESIIYDFRDTKNPSKTVMVTDTITQGTVSDILKPFLNELYGLFSYFFY